MNVPCILTNYKTLNMDYINSTTASLQNILQSKDKTTFSIAFELHSLSVFIFAVQHRVYQVT